MFDLSELLARYILEHDIRGTTIEYYGRVVGVYSSWSRDNNGNGFTARSVSEFLLAMQQADKSAYYRRSLRSGLVALLRYHGDDGRVRPVKLTDLDPQAWFPQEVAKLITCSAGIPPHDDPTYWPTLIPAAYHTGLSQCDLERLTRVDVTHDGIVRIHRSRTGKRSLTWMPPQLVESRPSSGPLWPRNVSLESFRKWFKKIVTRAGLSGTFKKLRKTSGTEFDLLYPGKGHEHLANTRHIFERHYNGRRIDPPPMRLPPLPDGHNSA